MNEKTQPSFNESGGRLSLSVTKTNLSDWYWYGTRLGGGSHDILSNPKSNFGIDTKVRGWVPSSLKIMIFQVGMAANFRGGGVNLAQKVKSGVFGLVL